MIHIGTYVHVRKIYKKIIKFILNFLEKNLSRVANANLTTIEVERLLQQQVIKKRLELQQVNF